MERSLPVLNRIEPARTCVWMDAGVVAFHLCDHGFACEHCSFDAAMRGDSRPAEASCGPDRPLAAWAFPIDRLYTHSHLWIQLIRDGRVRTGIDACASRFLAPLQRICVVPATTELRRGAPLCTLQVSGGDIPLCSPVSGRLCAWNEAVLERPSLLAAEPYTAGWLAELTIPACESLDRLLPSDAARTQATLDARLYLRQAAFRMLSCGTTREPWLDGEFLEAMRCLLGSESLTALTCQILH